MTWNNAYPEGHEYESGVHIRRFAVDRPRDVRRFNRLSERICFDVERSSIALQKEWMHAQGPICSALNRYLRLHRSRYDAFFFFGYLYATTYELLPLVEERAFLVPLAQDEWPIRMRIWNEFFKRPAGIIFNTPQEHDFVRTRFSRMCVDGPIIGCGIEPPGRTDPESFRARYGLREPFMLYLGRIDGSKGCDVLAEYFTRFRRRLQTPAKLVFIGEPHLKLPVHEDVVVLGTVDEPTKWNALAACELLAMPSAQESLCLAVLEAWSMGKAALVNAHCAPLVGQCRRSGGGLWYANYDEFEAALGIMDERVRDDLGAQGRSFVERAYSWQPIETAYRELLNASWERSII